MANLFAQSEALAFGKTRGAGAAEGTPDCAGAAPRLRRQPPEQHDPRRAADAAHARRAGRALRAQRVRAGRDLEHRLVRPVGRRARQGARDAQPPRTRQCDRAGARARQLDQRADPPLPRAPGARADGQRNQSARRPAGAGRATGRRREARRRLLRRQARSDHPAQRVAFGTSGHRGSSFDGSFNEDHILAITPGDLRVSRASRASTGRCSSASTRMRCRCRRSRARSRCWPRTASRC